MAPGMLATLLFATVAFSIAYAYLMAVRTRVGRVEDRAAGTILARPTPRARVPRRSIAGDGPPAAAPAASRGAPAYAPQGGGDA